MCVWWLFLNVRIQNLFHISECKHEITVNLLPHNLLFPPTPPPISIMKPVIIQGLKFPIITTVSYGNFHSL